MESEEGGAMRATLTALVTLLLTGCFVPWDFGGEEAWDFDCFLLRLPPQGEEDPDNKGFDKDGNKLVSPEVLATYAFPDIHAGYAWLDGDDPKLTPTVNLELCEVKIPYARWFVVAVGAGADEAHVYLGKRWTSIFEITTGVIWARRFDEDEWVPGIMGTLLKF